ncbi:MAG: ATP-binding cassette domain-containing protein [Alphaproteobacteria bacterium]|nr:ATP-binding cassette domain-containing protein [Alphaproteobacteria bacterium]
MEKRNVISFANVAARYDGGPEIISDVSFNISSHSFYFLTGASGAGKTTLLRLIYQLHKPSRGQIKMFGQNTAGISRDEIANIRRKMAIVFQEYSLISHLSVYDNIALPLRVRGRDEARIKKLVTQTLKWIGLSDYADTMPLNLSGGQQQRVAVARAVITQPEILIADEPTGNLDDASARTIMNLFIQMNKNFGTTIIMATHSMPMIDEYKFPVINVAGGKVNFSGVIRSPLSVIRDEEIKTKPELQEANNNPTDNGQRVTGNGNYFTELAQQFNDIAEGKKE